MMYPYMVLADGTEITHSHIIDDNGTEQVEVHFERATEQGLTPQDVFSPHISGSSTRALPPRKSAFLRSF